MSESQPNEDVATLKLELELERLERQWLEERQRYLVRGAVVPMWVSIVCGGGFVVLGINIAYTAHRNALLGLLLSVGFGVLFGGLFLWKALAYKEAEQRYYERRQRIIRDLEASRKRANPREGTDHSAS